MQFTELRQRVLLFGFVAERPLYFGKAIPGDFIFGV